MAMYSNPDFELYSLRTQSATGIPEGDCASRGENDGFQDDCAGCGVGRCSNAEMLVESGGDQARGRRCWTQRWSPNGGQGRSAHNRRDPQSRQLKIRRVLYPGPLLLCESPFLNPPVRPLLAAPPRTWIPTPAGTTHVGRPRARSSEHAVFPGFEHKGK